MGNGNRVLWGLLGYLLLVGGFANLSGGVHAKSLATRVGATPGATPCHQFTFDITPDSCVVKENFKKLSPPDPRAECGLILPLDLPDRISETRTEESTRGANASGAQNGIAISTCATLTDGKISGKLVKAKITKNLTLRPDAGPLCTEIPHNLATNSSAESDIDIIISFPFTPGTKGTGSGKGEVKLEWVSDLESGADAHVTVTMTFTRELTSDGQLKEKGTFKKHGVTADGTKVQEEGTPSISDTDDARLGKLASTFARTEIPVTVGFFREFARATYEGDAHAEHARAPDSTLLTDLVSSVVVKSYAHDVSLIDSTEGIGN